MFLVSEVPLYGVRGFVSLEHPQPILAPELLGLRALHRKVDIRLPEKGNSNSPGARPVLPWREAGNHLDDQVDSDQ